MIIDDSDKYGIFHTLANRLGVNNTNDCFKYGMPRKDDPVILNDMSPLWVASGENRGCVIEHLQLYNALLNKNLNFDIILMYKSNYGVMYQYSFKSNLKTRL
ncbi:hypothetical protein [Xenorhabdus anantnagensis]|uniref:Uncharacterized protein n=1 Tax=Xenorhabdus anantnagensis TaxID=3025875 RepID=A0ABT5LUV0_9GAMM|nr:hypothetical protein [Xenorhabdus anantnagensis]MDC9598200.1 hypothetical protein [Xenorhabdus anantnagensis]